MDPAMISANRKDVAAVIGLAVLAGAAVWLGVWGVQSKTGNRNESANTARRSNTSEESVPTPPREGQDGTTTTQQPARDLPGGADSIEDPASRSAEGLAAPDEESRFARKREDMVESQIRLRNVRDKRVLAAMRRVPRHRFVPPTMLAAAYEDRPLRIGLGQTISQPYIVALMTELARTNEESIALDIGTGSGYQAAVLAELCKKVYSIEIIDTLADQARGRLKELGYGNVTVRCGDGYRGWPEKGPFDLIIVAAAPDHIPRPLIDQLRVGGRLVIPVGRYSQNLQVVEKGPGGETREWTVTAVAFVPMTGEAQQPRQD